jgi:hypothetical protein
MFDGGSRFPSRKGGNGVILVADLGDCVFAVFGSAPSALICSHGSGSGSVLGMQIRIRIQEQGPKLTNNLISSLSKWLSYLVGMFNDIYLLVNKEYFSCQNPSLCDGKVWPGSRSGSGCAWIRIGGSLDPDPDLDQNYGKNLDPDPHISYSTVQ